MVKYKLNVEEMVASCLFEPRYGGADSERIWQEVKKSKDRSLYDFACALQDVESRFLAVLNAEVGPRVRALVQKQRAERRKRRRR